MTFDLKYENTHSTRTKYFAHTTGIDREGNECMMVVCEDSSASGCNPMHWASSIYNRYGHGFNSLEEALYQAKYADGSWTVKSINKDEIKVSAVLFETVNKAVNLGVCL